jgi:hypothetical protein
VAVGIASLRSCGEQNCETILSDAFNCGSEDCGEVQWEVLDIFEHVIIDIFIGQKNSFQFANYLAFSF